MKFSTRFAGSLGLGVMAFAPCTSAQAPAGDVYTAVLIDVAVEALSLFANPDTSLFFTSYSLFASGVTANCPGEFRLNQQLGLSRGFDGVNGLVLSNGYIEDVDADGPSTGSPSGCISASGSMGFPFCTAVDPSLAFLGPTEDATALFLRFTATVPIEIDIAYEFVTHEDPVDPAFFDVFGIFLDGTMVAGGSSNAGPAAGTDPWTLAPSSTAPYEFQQNPGVPRAVVPAYRTGRRVVTVPLSVGTHRLEYHVADSGPFQFCGTGTSDSSVLSSLFFGLHSWQADDPATVSPGVEIDYVGHPAPDDTNGGAFPADFQVTLEGAPPNTFASLVRGPSVMRPPLILPSIAPLAILVGPTLLVDTTLIVDANGSAAYPDPPAPIPAIIVGTPLMFQWFGLDPVTSATFATKALRAKF